MEDFPVLAVDVHWFNPLVWVMALLFNRDSEIFCDEKVMAMQGEGEKSAMRLPSFVWQNKKTAFFYVSWIWEKCHSRKDYCNYKNEENVKPKYHTGSCTGGGAMSVFASATKGVSTEPKDDNTQFIVEDKVLLSQPMIFNDQGVVDAHTNYKATDHGDGSVDFGGELTGIVARSQEEFAKRSFEKIPKLTVTAVELTASANLDVSTKSIIFTKIFGTYKIWGLAYEEVGETAGIAKKMYYQGQRSRHFADKSEKGVFTFDSIDGGTRVVHTEYDANGKCADIIVK